VYVTHGSSDVLARYLREVEGISAEPLAGSFRDDEDATHGA
jgi:putative mRNA 3-end processing factor